MWLRHRQFVSSMHTYGTLLQFYNQHLPSTNAIHRFHTPLHCSHPCLLHYTPPPPQPQPLFCNKPLVYSPCLLTRTAARVACLSSRSGPPLTAPSLSHFSTLRTRFPLACPCALPSRHPAAPATANSACAVAAGRRRLPRWHAALCFPLAMHVLTLNRHPPPCQ